MPDSRVIPLVQLDTALGDALLFGRLDGVERISQNGEFRISALSRRGDIRADELLARPVSLRLRTPQGGGREFNGIAAAFQQTGSEGRLHRYLSVVRPWTWLLTRTRDCRIFQDETTQDIIAEIFADHVLADFELGDDHARRPFRVQYRESDFVARLMVQEGMHGYFLHEGGRHPLVAADGAHVHEAAPGYERVPFLEPEQASSRQSEGIRRWSQGAEIQAGRCVTSTSSSRGPTCRCLPTRFIRVSIASMMNLRASISLVSAPSAAMASESPGCGSSRCSTAAPHACAAGHGTADRDRGGQAVRGDSYRPVRPDQGPVSPSPRRRSRPPSES